MQFVFASGVEDPDVRPDERQVTTPAEPFKEGGIAVPFDDDHPVGEERRGSPGYFLSWLRLDRFDAATSVPTLNRNYVHPVVVAFPPVCEQRRIVAAIEAAEAELQDRKREIEKLELLKHGLMVDLLTGLVREQVEA